MTPSSLRNPASLRRIVASVMAATAAFASSALGQEFPVRFDFDASSRKWANQSPIDEHSLSEWTATCGRTGGGIHLRGSGGDPEQQRIWRTVLNQPLAGRKLRMSAWVKGADVATVAALAVQARIPESIYMAGFTSSEVDHPLRGTFDWTRVSTEFDVPRACKSVQVLLMLVGNGEVWFDEVEIEDLGEAALIEPGLFSTKGSVRLAGTAPTDEPCTLIVPLPLDYQTQSLLSTTVSAEPPGSVTNVMIDERPSGERTARITLKPLGTGESVDVHWNSVTLVGPRSFADVPAKAALPPEWPADVAAWTQSSASVQSDSPAIRDAAASLQKEGADGIALINATLHWSRRVLENAQEPGLKDDAESSLTAPGGWMGAANLLTAVLRAQRVPARIVIGYPAWSGPTRSRGIVEAYIAGYGWYPIEPTLSRAPWPPEQHIVVAIVAPPNEASGSVPGVSDAGRVRTTPASAPVEIHGLIDPRQRNADHVTMPVRNFTLGPDNPAWAELTTLARAKWKQPPTPQVDTTGAFTFGVAETTWQSITVEQLRDVLAK